MLVKDNRAVHQPAAEGHYNALFHIEIQARRDNWYQIQKKKNPAHRFRHNYQARNDNNIHHYLNIGKISGRGAGLDNQKVDDRQEIERANKDIKRIAVTLEHKQTDKKKCRRDDQAKQHHRS